MILCKPLVEIQNVSFQYPGSETKVLDDASLNSRRRGFFSDNRWKWFREINSL